MYSIAHTLYCIYLRDRKDEVPSDERQKLQQEMDQFFERMRDRGEDPKAAARLEDTFYTLRDLDQEDAFLYGLATGIRLMTDLQQVADVNRLTALGEIAEQALL